MIRWRGVLEAVAFLALAFALAFAALWALELLAPFGPSGLEQFLRTPAAPFPVFIACVVASMAIVHRYRRRQSRPRRITPGC